MDHLLIEALIPIGVICVFGSALWFLFITMLEPAILYLKTKTLLRLYAWKPLIFFLLGCIAFALSYTLK